MTIRTLRTLVAVADVKTFSAAARVVHVTHAAVSQQMRALEAELGVELFSRDTRTPELTQIGQQVVERARKVVLDYENLVPSEFDSGNLSGTVRLGVLRTTLTGLVPEAMGILKERYPKIWLHITPGLTGTLLAEVERGNLDAAIVTKPNRLPPGFVFRFLVDEPLQLIAAVEETESDPIKLLKTRPFIRFNRSAVVGALIDNWILSKRISVREAMELDGLEAIASMVHANLGVSVVPDLAVKSHDALPLTRINLGRDAPHRSLGLIYLESQTKIAALTEIFKVLENVIGVSQRADGQSADDH